MFASVTARIRRWRVQTLKPFGKNAPDRLRISVGDANPDLAGALATAFADADDVEVVMGNLLDLDCDAIVSRPTASATWVAASTRRSTIFIRARPSAP
jgi:hypothetical protein